MIHYVGLSSHLEIVFKIVNGKTDFFEVDVDPVLEGVSLYRGQFIEDDITWSIFDTKSS